MKAETQRSFESKLKSRNFVISFQTICPWNLYFYYIY